MKIRNDQEAKEVIGGEENFWLYSKSEGFDLTHPVTPTSPSPTPRLVMESTKGPVTIDPKKTGLVVVDMQNYFLSPLIGRPSDAVGLKAMDKLLQYAIPACRKAGIPAVWLNWGLTEQDVEQMPPAIVKGFAADVNFEGDRTIGGLGSEMGSVKLEGGSVIDGGRVLMRDQWNSALYAPLDQQRQSGDLWIYKNRLSGFWGGTEIEKALSARGIRTLLFAGANLDQCVASSLQDAFNKGWDCLLLKDGSATTSPDFARKCIEFNTEEGWGFVVSCEDFAGGVKKMQGPDVSNSNTT